MTLGRLLRIVVLYLRVQFANLWSLFQPQAEAPDPITVNNVLIFGYMGIGDSLMFQATLSSILKHYPNASFDLIGPISPVIEILQRTAESQQKPFRNTITQNYKQLTVRELFALDHQLSSQKYDLVVCTYMTPVPYFTEVIRSIPFRVGHSIQEQWYKPRPNRLFNLQVDLEQDHTHETVRHSLLAKKLGALVGDDLTPRLNLTNFEIEYAEKFWKDHQLEGKTVVGTHFGASKIQHWKKWDDERFAEVLEDLTRQLDPIYLLFGVEEEHSQILSASKHVRERAIDLVGKLGMFEVAALFSKCSMMLGNDSGLGHIAISVGTPAVRVFGMSDYWGYRSLSSANTDVFKGVWCSPCLQLGYLKPLNVHNCGHKNCMKLIEPDEVLRATMNTLKAK